MTPQEIQEFKKKQDELRSLETQMSLQGKNLASLKAADNPLYIKIDVASGGTNQNLHLTDEQKLLLHTTAKRAVDEEIARIQKRIDDL